MKSSALAYSNIAFIKYWGKSNEVERLPLNSSISMNLSNLKTITTVEFSSKLKDDDIAIDGQKSNDFPRVLKHLDRLRKLAGTQLAARVVSKNNFPSSTGLSSSASGFAALTLAASYALGLKLSEKELSIQARLGSGSACRSIPGGFVEWKSAKESEESYAYAIFPQSFWSIVDVVAVISTKKKIVSTTDAQKYVLTSPFIKTRLSLIENKIQKLKNAIKTKNFKEFGEIIEAECLELHSIFMTQSPPLIYLLPETLSLFHHVRNWRNEGLMVYFTLNTGHNVHLLCQKEDEKNLLSKLKDLQFIKKTIINYPAGEAKIINGHLF